jgi:hypothetical protein
MTEYKAKDFNTRKALDTQVITDFGKTVDVKDAKITGTIQELKELGLEQNQNIWGVKVMASNYKVINNPKVKRGIRGKRVASKINGQKI